MDQEGAGAPPGLYAFRFCVEGVPFRGVQVSDVSVKGNRIRLAGVGSDGKGKIRQCENRAAHDHAEPIAVVCRNRHSAFGVAGRHVQKFAFGFLRGKAILGETFFVSENSKVFSSELSVFFIFLVLFIIIIILLYQI